MFRPNRENAASTAVPARSRKSGTKEPAGSLAKARKAAASMRPCRSEEEEEMIVRNVMYSNVRLVAPEDSVSDAARIMAEIDAGVLPVGDGDRLVGMLTDRDIALRVVGRNRGPDTPVSEAMTQEVRYCFEDEDVQHVCRNMGDQQLHRLPVLDRDKRLVGIISLGDVAFEGEEIAGVGDALAEISRPTGQHSQL
jgi:CBS domain-containing protein